MDAGEFDAGVHAGSEGAFSAGGFHLDIGGGLGVAARAERVLAVVRDLEGRAGVRGEGVDEGGEGAVAFAANRLRLR